MLRVRRVEPCAASCLSESVGGVDVAGPAGIAPGHAAEADARQELPGERLMSERRRRRRASRGGGSANNVPCADGDLESRRLVSTHASGDTPYNSQQAPLPDRGTRGTRARAARASRPLGAAESAVDGVYRHVEHARDTPAPAAPRHKPARGWSRASIGSRWSASIRMLLRSRLTRMPVGNSRGRAPR